MSAHCSTYVWYAYRWYHQKKLSPKTQRIFDVGNALEPVIIGWIESMYQTKVYGQQKEVYPHEAIKGHIDGLIKINGDEHLLEIKTSNKSRFNTIKNHGIVLEHKRQMWLYMYGLGLKKGLYVVANKDDSTLYEEIIAADNTAAKTLIDKILGLVIVNEPPPPRYHPTFYRCKMCEMWNYCHAPEKVERPKHCRTCKNSSVTLQDNVFTCSRYGNNPIPLHYQCKGCDQWA